MNEQTELLRHHIAQRLAEERLLRKKQEWRARCYAEVLALYAHKLAVAQARDPGKVIREARAEVQERLKAKDWLETWL